MNKAKLYGYYIMNFLSRGAKIRKGEIASDGIVTKYGAVLTRKYVRKIFCIKRFTPLDVGNPMGRIFRKEIISKYPGVKVVIHLHNEPQKINIKEAVFLRRYTRAETMYNAYKQEFAEMSGSEQISGKQYYGNNGRKFVVNKKDYLSFRDMYRSYQYVTDCVSNDIALFKTSYFVEVLIPDNIKQDSVIEEFHTICNKAGLIYETIEAKTNKFLANMGLTATKKEARPFSQMLFSAENIGLNSSYLSPGLVGGGGILHGIDQRSGLPLTINYFNSGGAKVGIIIGESGCGKTMEAFNMALQFIGQDIHCSVLDLKGGEWIALEKFGVKVANFGMNNQEGSYVNILRLDDIVTEDMSDEEIQELIDMAVTGTVKLLAVMVDIQPREGSPRDVENILREATQKVFSRALENKKNRYEMARGTRNLNYKNVIDIVRDFGRDAVKNAEDVANYDIKRSALCRLIVQRCSPFVENYSSTGALFKKEIKFKEVLDAELVIYSMNKNQESQVSIEDTVRLYMIQYMDIKKQYYRKRQHKHTVAFYEEVQRCAKMEQVTDYISAMATGGRSNNLAMFLLLNSISTFKGEAFDAIRSNITLIMAGKMKDADVNALIKDFDCYDIKDMLEDINPDASKVNVNSKRKRHNFGNCFAIKFRRTETEYDRAIFRLEVPPDVEEGFHTTDYRSA